MKSKIDFFEFKCQDCGYIHTTSDGSEPNQCVDCGGANFREIDSEESVYKTSNRNPILKLFDGKSLTEIVLYLIFFVLLFGNLFTTIALLILQNSM